MYTGHFGLNEKPFSISPDPRYLYLSARHADALAHLLYGISESGGFIQLTGEVGTGKTTLIRSLFGQLPDKTEIALILNPKLSTKQFLQSICHELGVAFVDRDTAKALIDRLNERLLALHADNRRAVLIVDEAQTMSPELLEQVRLLTNLETDRQKLLQIILIGQPELRDMLALPSMRQIAQRITGRYHLEPLTADDTAVYIAHRLKVAGGQPAIFSPRAVRRLFRLSRGIPRLINVIADRALLAAYTRDELRVGPRLVRQAATEVFGRPPARPGRWPWAAVAAGLLLIGFAATRLHDADPETLELALADAVTSPAESAGTAQPAFATIGADANVADPGDGGDVANGDGDTAGSADVAAISALLAAAPTDMKPALGDLFALWGLNYDPSGAACYQAEAAGLACLTVDVDDIGELRQLARPAVVELIDPVTLQGHWVTLTAISEDHADVMVQGMHGTIPLNELTRVPSQYPTLLFRPAIRHDSGSFGQGLRDPGVLWLRRALEDLTGEDLQSAEPDLYDEVLADAVARYQARAGLEIDGVVGDRTLIGIQTELGLIGVPLTTEPD